MSTIHNANPMQTTQQRRFSGFDYLVIVGGLINLAVVGTIISYWLFK